MYGRDENDENFENKIEYTPNQTISQLNPVKIEIQHKVSTLRHQSQMHLLSNNKSIQNKPSYIIPRPKKFFKSNNNFSHTLQNINSSSLNKASKQSLNQNKSNTINLVRSASNIKNQSGNSLQPFELTIRVQVNLPFNQMTTVRVKPDILLDELFDKICKEANLQSQKYILTIPNINVDELLMKYPLSHFDTKEVNLIFSRNLVSCSRDNRSYYQQKSFKKKKNSRIINQKHNNQINLMNGSLNGKSKAKSEIDLSISSHLNNNQKQNVEIIDQLKRNIKASRYSMFCFFSKRKSAHELCTENTTVGQTLGL